MLISSFSLASSASQTNHHLLVRSCGGHNTRRKSYLVLTKHFVLNSVFCHGLALDALVALRTEERDSSAHICLWKLLAAWQQQGRERHEFLVLWSWFGYNGCCLFLPFLISMLSGSFIFNVI